MATQRLTIDGYGQIELNRVSFPITGKVIADLPLDTAFTVSAPAENGMVLAINYPAGEVTLPTGTDAILGLHFSAEKEYDPNIAGLKQFKLVAGGFYPRLGIPAVGDRFTTNTICYSDIEFETETLLKSAIANAGTTPLYAIPDVTGALKLTATLGTPKLGFQVVKATTMPDGSYGVKLVTIVAQ